MSVDGRVRRVARGAVLAYVADPPVPGSGYRPDAGPALVATMLAADDADLAPHAVALWLHGFRAGLGHPNLSVAGMARFLAGATAARALDPRLATVTDRLRGVLCAWSAPGCWRSDAVGWSDYDLITGPAGVALAFAADPDCQPSWVLPPARHLVALADSADLRRLRIGAYAGDELRGWNQGRINTGLGHGVPGLLAALTAACDLAASTTATGRDGLADAVRRVAGWLATNSFVDDRGVRSWGVASLDGRPPPERPSHRQAWCYGTPGVAWPLWEAGRVLDDPALQRLAADAMRSFCAAWDDDFYLDDDSLSATLAICHGAAGTLAVADAFAVHAGLAEAAALRDHLDRYLHERLDQVAKLATDDLSVLTGAGGILAVLLTVRGGGRAWLRQIALR
jgi:hypothetical protein